MGDVTEDITDSDDGLDILKSIHKDLGHEDHIVREHFPHLPIPRADIDAGQEP